MLALGCSLSGCDLSNMVFIFDLLRGFRFLPQVYDNEFISTMAGAISVQRLPQGKICHNSCEDGPCEVIG